MLRLIRIICIETLLRLPGALLIFMGALGAANAIPNAVSEFSRMLTVDDSGHILSVSNYWGYYLGPVVIYCIILLLGYILYRVGKELRQDLRSTE